MTDERGIHTTSVLRDGAAGPDGAATADALRAHSRRVDEGGRFQEELLFLGTPAGRLFVTLVEPTGSRRGAAFLSCHSFAWEQLEQSPLELGFARAAASSGFPTAVFHARGYGDAGGDLAEASLGTQARDATEVARFLAERAGGISVVPVGIRFGATAALTVADELEPPGIALWEPVVAPGRHLDILLKAYAMSRVMEEVERSGGKRRGAREMKAELLGGEPVDVFGYPLGPEAYREAQAARPVDDLRHTPGRSLVVSVNPARRRSGQEVSRRLEELGSEVRLEDVEGPGRSEFGLGVPVGGHLARHQPMFDDLAARTIRWAKEAW